MTTPELKIEISKAYSWDDTPQHRYIIRVLLGKQHTTLELDTCISYNHAKHQLGKDLMKTAAHRYSSACRGGMVSNKEAESRRPIQRYYRLACEALRILRDEHGVTLSKGTHPMHYHRWHPKEGDIAALEPYWSRDRVFRAACKQVIKGRPSTWESLTQQALDYQADITSGLTKPWRRRLAEGKLSFAVANRMSRRGNCPDHHTTPRWAWRSAEVFSAWNKWRHMPGMHCITRRQCDGLMELHDDLLHLIRIARNLGVRVPVNYAGYVKFDKDAHDRTSLLYRAISERQDTQGDLCYFEEMPALPPLEHPDFVECKVLWKRDDLRAEGLEMEHCVGLYAGQDAFIASVKRGDERATLMVSRDGFNNQCFGKRNAITPLSTEIRAKWFPVLKELVASTQPVIRHQTKPDYSNLTY